MELSKDLAKLAHKNVGEEEKKREEFLESLKEWLKLQPHLHARTEDSYLISFLRGTNYSLEVAKQKLDAFYTYRSALPDLFANRDPSAKDIQIALESKAFIFIKPKSVKDKWIAVCMTQPDHPSRISATSLVRLVGMMFDVLLKEAPEISIVGCDIVADSSNFSASHAAMWPVSLIKKTAKLLQDCYPVQVGNIVIVNTNKFMQAIGELMKAFFKQEIRNQMYVYVKGENPSALKEIQDNLPKELGGKNGNLDDHVAFWKNRLEVHREWLMEDEQYGCTETLRPGKQNTYEDIFGMEGSFRKLTVD